MKLVKRVINIQDHLGIETGGALTIESLFIEVMGGYF